MKNEQPAATSIDEYISNFPVYTQQILRDVHATIQAAAPGADEKISYGMPTFTMNDKYLIYFAGWKNHISIYPIPTGNEEFNLKIAPYISGKGTLKFPADRRSTGKNKHQI
jgi:uncharacterized protein YdhG (YjbR/CyaY superfamily)